MGVAFVFVPLRASCVSESRAWACALHVSRVVGAGTMPTGKNRSRLLAETSFLLSTGKASSNYHVQA
jgi:hypothetical protein